VALVNKPLGLNLHIEGIAALPHLLGDAGQLRQAFTNLIENAIQAASTDAPEVWVVGTIAEGRALISVEDNGAGVDPSILSRLFEPLITTKSSGTGLGLSLVQRIAERHGGTVEYAPRERGARFVVTLPVA
jgi:signal transduction histidine kinase